MRVLGIVFSVFAILVWGITFVNTRALLFDFSALEILVLRFGMAWAALAVISCFRCGATDVAKITWRDEGVFAAMGLCGVFIYQFLENCAIYYTNASNVAILVSLGPVVTAILLRMFSTQAKDVGYNMWIGSAVAILGVAFVSFNNVVVFELRPLGDLMALVAMASWGVYSFLIDKVNKRGYSQLVVIRKTFGWALIYMLPFVIWGMTDIGYTALDGSFSIMLDPAVNVTRFTESMNWANLCFLGLLASALCFVFWNVACKSLGVVRTTIGLYFTPIVGVIFAVVFLDEKVTLLAVLGGAFIICGVMIANWRTVR